MNWAWSIQNNGLFSEALPVRSNPSFQSMRPHSPLGFNVHYPTSFHCLQQRRIEVKERLRDKNLILKCARCVGPSSWHTCDPTPSFTTSNNRPQYLDLTHSRLNLNQSLDSIRVRFDSCGRSNVARWRQALLGQKGGGCQGWRSCRDLRLGFDSGDPLEGVCGSLLFSWMEFSCLSRRFSQRVSEFLST